MLRNPHGACRLVYLCRLHFYPMHVIASISSHALPCLCLSPHEIHSSSLLMVYDIILYDHAHYGKVEAFF